jgi:O-antigen/teichoic acid export membrane protein
VTEAAARQQIEPKGFAEQVKGAVLWRSGSQLAGQLVSWTATFMVVRLLTPSDYGLVAMCDVVFTFLGLMSGWGFASALIRSESVTREQIRQVFGLLILTNFALALIQFALAPVAASYFRQPMIADLLRVQAALYLVMPFIALPQNLLARRLDFKRQGQVNLAAAFVSAATALSCAWAGLGPWTLIAAPAALWVARAIGFSIAARLWILPSFRFAGTGKLVSFGGAMVAVQFFWFAQSQADVFIAGRVLPAHELGLYTTALFLTQIVAAKFVPPLNDVAFAAYAKIQDEHERMRGAFLKSIRLIMLVAMPFYCGLVVAAEPLVHVLLGPQWLEAAPLVSILALAMPLMTLQILFAPATNAMGAVGVGVKTGAAGAVLMPIAFLVGIGWGMEGLSWAWLTGMAMLLALTIILSLPVIGVSPAQLLAAVSPGWLSAAGMAFLVAGLDWLLAPIGQGARLATLVSFGLTSYFALLFLFARPIVVEAIDLVRPGRSEVARA